MTLAPGATLGPYRIVEQIGKGGMATVYKAYQPSLARHVAIKVLPAFFAEEEGFRERFQQEAIAIAKLRHPNILQVFDYGEEGGVTYIVSEFVDGGTLAEQLGRPLPADYVVRMLAPIASALDYAHARGILHRDIKPSNILLQRDGTPVLSDFGLARMTGSVARLTRTGATIGTPEYMAPEQAQGDEVGAGADLYALAVIVYEMLTGRVPFVAETPVAVLLAHLHKPLPLPRQVNPEISAGVQDVVLKGLAKTPQDRYPTATAFIAALADAGRVPGVATSFGAVAAAATAVRRGRARPHPALLVGAAALALVVSVGLVALLQRPEARVAESTAPPAGQATPAASPTPATTATAAAFAKGALLYEARLDAAGSDLERRQVLPDASAGELRTSDGALEFIVKKPGAIVAAVFRRSTPARYVGEILLALKPGAQDLGFQWRVAVGESGEHALFVLSARETVTLRYVEGSRGSSDRDDVSTAVKVRGLQSGRQFVLGIAIDGARYAIFLDGQQVAEGKDDRLGQRVAPILLRAGGGQRGEGTMVVKGLRIFAAR